jgi:hypothetical protein
MPASYQNLKQSRKSGRFCNSPPTGPGAAARRATHEVFGEGDPTKRRAAIKELYTDDCVLYVPQVPSLGTMPSINLQVI